MEPQDISEWTDDKWLEVRQIATAQLLAPLIQGAAATGDWRDFGKQVKSWTETGLIDLTDGLIQKTVLREHIERKLNQGLRQLLGEAEPMVQAGTTPDEILKLLQIRIQHRGPFG